jgi:hypothetical protein
MCQRKIDKVRKAHLNRTFLVLDLAIEIAAIEYKIGRYSHPKYRSHFLVGVLHPSTSGLAKFFIKSNVG